LIFGVTLGNKNNMRLALLTLAASTAALSAAYAQETAAPAMPAAPAAEAAAPAALAAPEGTTPAEVAPPPPEQQLAPLATDPLGLTIVDTLEKVCKPIASGAGSLDAVAKADGFALKRKMWTKAIDKAGTQIVIQPTSTANPTTCVMLINHPKEQFQTMVNGLHGWASRQDPIMQLRAPYAYNDQVTGMKRTTVGWEAPSVTSTTGMTGMAFTQLARLNGREIVKGMDQTELMFQIRK